MQISSSFGSQGASDAAYPSGNYVFSINTAHSGLKTPTLNLNLSGSSYPAPVQITNYTAAQSIDPSQFFSLQWSPIPGGSTNDLVWFYVLDPSNNFNVVFSTPYPKVVGSLDGTSTGAGLIAGTLLPSHSYYGVLVYIRHVSVNTTDYPGAVGVVSFSSANTFAFATTNPPPPHFVSGFYLGAGGFTFTFSGQSSQNYALQVSTNLTTWTNLVVTNSVSGTIQYTDTHTAGFKARFYRAVTAP